MTWLTDWFFNSKPSPVIDSVHVASINQIALAPEYVKCWNYCVIDPDWADQALTAANAMIKNKAIYEQVEASIKVPWFVVGCIHYREASFDFSTCLHNGDPLPGPTIHVPSGRGPFGTWADAAVDALKFDGLDQVKSWDVSSIFYELESYNGFGYRSKHYADTKPAGASPYIYSATQFYSSGLYVEDGVFHSDKVDDQLGCMALLKQLEIMKQISL